ncbi:MAG TPA: LysM domain-containing protein [Gemmatimonadales bacterium]|jgi:LysM repeat protein|nr:LysM domain-containing protein [Gemmatimonadales bacterium]
MPRTFHRKWLGMLALAVSPTLVLAQEATPQSHTVRQGDTLWDLAKQYRGDPFLWPDIYRMNTATVADPHWIYPGEVLRLAGADTVPSVPATDTPIPPVAEAADTVPAVANAADSSAAATDSSVAAADTVQAGEPAAVTAQAPVTDSEVSHQLTLAQLTSASATDEGPAPLFASRRSQMLQETIRGYVEQPYRPLRRSEFYSSGFLTEGENLPFGKVVGPVTPQQIRSEGGNASALPYSLIAVEAPRGATYQIGDSLLVAQLGAELRSHDEVVMPTGLARVVDTVSGRYIASVDATYGPIRSGQRVLPAEKFTPSGTEHAVRVSNGVRARLLGGPGRQEMKAPQMVLFLDKGRADGVAAGDLFEVRRRAERLSDGSQRINELMATLQIVHVREHTATARIMNVVSPDIPPGTDAVQVAKLPS